MRLILDNIIFQLQESGGISVVWYELLSRLLKEQDIDICFLDNPDSANPFRKGLSIPEDSIIGGFKHVFATRGLPVRIKDDKPFLFHSSYYRYCPNAINITTLHDFTNEYFVKGIKKRLHTWQKFNALRNSRRIVCISENTKRELLHFLPDIGEEKIRVIYNGVSDDYFVTDAPPLSPLPYPSGSYVLFVGTRTTYKNFFLVCRSLKETKYNLVIVGSQLSASEKRQIEQYLPPSRYKCMGFIKNGDLNMLYNHAACLAYPSFYEGFGIPIPEAQKAGCPVIAYRATSVPEVCGESPLLMDRADEATFLEKLRLLDNRQLMKEVCAKGIENAKRFTWDAMYQSYLRLYEELWR